MLEISPPVYHCVAVMVVFGLRRAGLGVVECSIRKKRGSRVPPRLAMVIIHKSFGCATELALARVNKKEEHNLSASTTIFP